MSQNSRSNAADAIHPSSNNSGSQQYLDYVKSRDGKNFPVLINTQSEVLARALQTAKQVASVKVPVTIYGEDAVGKNLLAQYMHQYSENRTRPFISLSADQLNSLRLVDARITGSIWHQNEEIYRLIKQLFDAGGGTLLISEVGKIDKHIQQVFEQFFDDNSETTILPRHTRIISTSATNLAELVAKGMFEKSLFYRLNVIKVKIPALRERLEDVPFLTDYFANLATGGNHQVRFSDEAMKRIMNYSWPGNLKQFSEVIQKTITQWQDAKVIEPEMIRLPVEERRGWIKSLPIGLKLRDVETHFIIETLKYHKGNRTHSAKTLGISLRTLRNKINEFQAMGMKVPAPENYKPKTTVNS